MNTDLFGDTGISILACTMMQILHPILTMSRHRQWLLFLIASAAALATYFIATTEKEPSYQGRTLTGWLAYAGNEDPEVREAFQQMGTNSIPFLLKWMASKPSGWRYRLMIMRDSGRGWIPSWVTSDLQNRRQAYSFIAFRELGPLAESAVPQLAFFARSNDQGICASACAVLAWIRPEGIPALVRILADTSAPIHARFYATRNLNSLILGHKIGSGFATNAEIAVLPLIRNLGDSDPSIAAAAADLLGALSLEPELCIPALTNALNETRSESRVAAMNGLCQLNPRPEVVFSIITNAALNDTSRDVRLRAIQGLRGSGDAAAPALRRAIEESDSAIRFQVMAAYHSVAPSELTNSAMLVMANCALDSPDSGLRSWAIYALANFGRDALVKSPDLVAMLNDSDPVVRTHATQAIFRIVPELITNAPPQ